MQEVPILKLFPHNFKCFSQTVLCLLVKHVLMRFITIKFYIPYHVTSREILFNISHTSYSVITCTKWISRIWPHCKFLVFTLKLWFPVFPFCLSIRVWKYLPSSISASIPHAHGCKNLPNGSSQCCIALLPSLSHLQTHPFHTIPCSKEERGRRRLSEQVKHKEWLIITC